MTVRKHATIGKGSIGTLLGVSFDGVGKLIYTVSFGVKVARFRQPGCICAYCSAVSVHLQQVNTIVTDSHLYLWKSYCYRLLHTGLSVSVKGALNCSFTRIDWLPILPWWIYYARELLIVRLMAFLLYLLDALQVPCAVKYTFLVLFDQADSNLESKQRNVQAYTWYSNWTWLQQTLHSFFQNALLCVFFNLIAEYSKRGFTIKL